MTLHLTELFARGRPVILDGAMGTELLRRGVDIGLPLWSANALLTAPDVVRRIHEEYIGAGAEIITTNTFRTTRRAFRNAKLPDRSGELTLLAVDLARQARALFPARTVLIAGSIAPLEDCYHPERVPPDAELREEHAEHAGRLVDAGADILLLETIGTVREALAAAGAARATGKEFIVSFICNQEGMLYGGEPLPEAVRTIAPLSPAAISINCVSPRFIGNAITTMRTALAGLPGGNVPLAVYANVGLPGEEQDGEIVCDVDPDEYLSYVRGWILAGVSIIGGCCGTTPEYISKLSTLVRKAHDN